MRAERFVSRSLQRILDEGLHGINEPLPARYLRGVEMLGEEFAPGLVRAVEIYHKNHECWPDLIDPQTFGNKQLLFKFFGLVPCVTPSDKLRAHDWLSPRLRAQIRRPAILWSSAHAEVPLNDEVAPGTYWLKCNHGSGTNLPVTFPLGTEERADLAALTRRWMRRVHSTRLSLWWYELMERRVYLEEDLREEGAGDAADWKFYVCNGRVVVYQHDADRSGAHQQTVYSRAGTWLNKQLYVRKGLSKPVAAPAQLDLMVEAAEAIGQFFDFIRVDMFLRGGEVYLGEIGLVPNGCTKRVRAPELDWMLGGAWRAPWLGRVSPGFADGHYRRDWPFDSGVAQASRSTQTGT
jgi:hypothetical protein